MKTRRSGSLYVAAVVLAATALPSFAEGGGAAVLKDGKLHGFTGCLTQEASGTRYFNLEDAKSDDGKKLGTIRLTSSLWGIRPKDALNHEVHVNGLYRGHLKGDPAGGHVAVKNAAVSGNSCSS